MKLVLESPLAGDFQRNRLYALHCARVLALSGHHVFASHLQAPYYLDDRSESEREAGFSLTEAFTDNTCSHAFAVDRGVSGGMLRTAERYVKNRTFYVVSLFQPRLSLISLHDLFRWRERMIGEIWEDVQYWAHTGDGPSFNRTEAIVAWNRYERGAKPPCTPGFELGGAL